ncbi:MAG: transcriptional repressor LexA [Clostridia bacterium]|nr:transcriptional repressor LexA [Clostridia bacterium]
MATGKKQNNEEKILSFIKDQISTNGYPPSVREICSAVGLKSTSSVHSYLKELEKQGRIKLGSDKKRAMSVVSGHSSDSYHSDRYVSRESSVSSLPLIGRISAGTPILAEESIDQYFTVSSTMLHGEECFLLRVTGDSMIEAGILDGDMLIVRRQDNANNGDIVVALIDGEEATVKAFYKEEGHYRLQPRNSSMDPIIVDKDSLTILGKVTGLIRTDI